MSVCWRQIFESVLMRLLEFKPSEACLCQLNCAAPCSTTIIFPLRLRGRPAPGFGELTGRPGKENTDEKTDKYRHTTSTPTMKSRRQRGQAPRAEPVPFVVWKFAKEFVVKQLREDYDQDFSAVISKSLFFSINIANNPCTTELLFTLF